MRVRIKICGITRLEDALEACHLGVDALGFVFYPKSPRFVEPEAAAAIIRALPPFVTPVGVFVDTPEMEIRQILRRCRLQALQFHGEEPPLLCRRFREPVIKAFRVGDPPGLRGEHLREAVARYELPVVLLDTQAPTLPGGTGEPFDWQEARAVPPGVSVILAGGLTPENVGAAIRAVGPYGVDVSSGVERAPGIKDPARMRAFVEAVWEAR